MHLVFFFNTKLQVINVVQLSYQSLFQEMEEDSFKTEGPNHLANQKTIMNNKI